MAECGKCEHEYFSVEDKKLHCDIDDISVAPKKNCVHRGKFEVKKEKDPVLRTGLVVTKETREKLIEDHKQPIKSNSKEMSPRRI